MRSRRKHLPGLEHLRDRGSVAGPRREVAEPGPRFPSAGLHEAYTICSVAGDLKINETVDLPNWLVSMTLPRGIFA
jgi:hypothetical protein